MRKQKGLKEPKQRWFEALVIICPICGRERKLSERVKTICSNCTDKQHKP